MNTSTSTAIAPVVLVNFHAYGKKLTTQLRLQEQQLTPEELEQREEARRARNTGARANRVDTGKPVLNGQAGETNLVIQHLIEDLCQYGYRLVDAYTIPKYQWENGKPTSKRIGTIARFVFAVNQEAKFEDPGDEAFIRQDLLEELAVMNPAPLVIAWRNRDAEGNLSTDTINVVPLKNHDERAKSPGAVRALRIKRDGQFTCLSYRAGQEYFALE